MVQQLQLNFTPEIEVFHMLFDRSLSISSMTSPKHRMEYFNFRCKIQLDLPVRSNTTYKFYLCVRQVPHGRQVVLEQLGIPLLSEQLRQDAEPTRLNDAHFVVRVRRQNCKTGGIWEIIWY